MTKTIIKRDTSTGTKFEDELTLLFHSNGYHITNYRTKLCIVCDKYSDDEHRIIRQYPYNDITGKKSIFDFYHRNCNNKGFYIEAKYQIIPGSTDAKLKGYLYDIEKNVFGNDSFIFLFNNGWKGNKNVLSYLQTINYVFLYIDKHMMSHDVINDIRSFIDIFL